LSAVNASFVPSGDGATSRICFAVNVRASSILLAKRTSGPISTFTSAVNGMRDGAEPSTGARQISPPCEITTARESGVNEKPGSTSIDARDS
jgi:hypothetical protein